MLKLSDISFNYPNSNQLFDQFSFQAEPGAIVLVKGSSGSGKTTLLNIICGVIPKMIAGEFSGNVRLDDLSINSCSLPQIAPHISLLMQDPDLQLFFPIVEQEIAFGPENLRIEPELIKVRISIALQLLGIEQLRLKETANLSFGEKKLVALAALIALDPQVFLLDEPAAGISEQQIIKLKKVIKQLSGEGKIIFITEHQADFIELAAHTIDLDIL